VRITFTPILKYPAPFKSIFGKVFAVWFEYDRWHTASLSKFCSSTQLLSSLCPDLIWHSDLCAISWLIYYFPSRYELHLRSSCIWSSLHDLLPVCNAIRQFFIYVPLVPFPLLKPKRSPPCTSTIVLSIILLSTLATLFYMCDEADCAMEYIFCSVCLLQ
jgi:hypothetical protein